MPGLNRLCFPSETLVYRVYRNGTFLIQLFNNTWFTISFFAMPSVALIQQQAANCLSLVLSDSRRPLFNPNL